MVTRLKISILLILFASCARSLHPITDKEEEMIFKKELLGNWKVIRQKDSQINDAIYNVDTLPGTNGKRYSIQYISIDPDTRESDTSYLMAFLVRLKQGYFLDCSTDTSRESFGQLDEMAKGLLINSHIISRIKMVDETTISNSFIDIDKLDDLITEKRIKLDLTYVADEDDVLLLESTEGLQKKLNEAGKLISVFTNEEILKKY